MRDRPSIETRLRFACGEHSDLNPETAFGRGDPSQFEETPEADYDLPVEWVGFGQAAGEVAGDNRVAGAYQPYLPGLPVMRVRCKNRVAERVKPNIVKSTLHIFPRL
ncbi:MAG: hypothetical protein NW215_14815 [Hyphomicrobiales bacterium]|nr:hypothetical protein [Hyphomicrobiales bacterium]